MTAKPETVILEDSTMPPVVDRTDKKKKKTDKKRTRSKQEDADEAEEPNSNDLDATEEAEDNEQQEDGKDSDRKAKRAAKRANKEDIMKQVPLTDSDGISYTKLQIRRMMKRVQRGLAPVPTEEEENQRRRAEKQSRLVEEEELMGNIYRRSKDTPLEDSDNKEDSDAENEENGEMKEPQDDAADEEETEAGAEKVSKETTTVCPPATKKAKRSKPVPIDYLCQACKNKKGRAAHWIYDCPDKLRVPGTNKKKKRERGIHQPNDCKVFVAGLPFDIKRNELHQYFEDESGYKVVHCKLVTFEDTGRCKGTGFVTFESVAGATAALKQSGSIFPSIVAKGHKKKTDKQKEIAERRSDLKLKVTKVLSRLETKKAKEERA
jgi:hypothetical protein